MSGRNFLENIRANPNVLKNFYKVIVGLTITKHIFSSHVKSTE